MAHGEESEYIDDRLYGDIAEAGGLATAIAETARAMGVDVGRVRCDSHSPHARAVTAYIGSPRGDISVLLGVQERAFSVTCTAQGFYWAGGVANSIEEVVAVADAWRRGILLEHLIRDFPFMRGASLATAYERGDQVAAKWRSVLQAEYPPGLSELIRAAYANARLVQLLPAVSYGSLLLASPGSRPSDVVSIEPMQDGTYRISDAHASAVEVSLKAVIHRAAEFSGRRDE